MVKMKKKIIIISVLAVFMLVAISLATAANTERTVEKEESPLYKHRINNVIGEKIIQLRQNFIKNRIFLRFSNLNLKNDEERNVLISGRFICPSIWTKCI